MLTSKLGLVHRRLAARAGRHAAGQLRQLSALQGQQTNPEIARAYEQLNAVTQNQIAGTAAPSPAASADLAAQLASYPATDVTTLSNGMRVASESNGGDTATVGVWIDAGSRYETAETNGTAHFLEHMFFKGTANRTRQSLEVEVENMGGHLNAYTSREQTVFYAKVPKENVPRAMDILADILQNSQITPESVEREKDVILREHQEVEGQMEEVIFDRLHETAYRGTALGRTILGSPDNIRSITREHIQDYLDTHYVAPRMVVAGAGAVEHQDLVGLSNKLFGNMPTEGKKAPVMEPAQFTGSDIRVRFDDMPLAHVALGFPTAGWSDADTFPLLLIQTLLGSWDSSTTGGAHSSSSLVSELAKGGEVQSMSTFNTQYSDTGLFGIYATCEPTGQNDLMYNMTHALTSLCYEVEPERLEEAKNQLKMNMLAQLDGSTVICEDIGRQLLTYGRRMHPTEVLARIDAIDREAVINTANRYFYDRDHALAAVGPTFELPDYNWIRRRSYWLRY
jgi:processing peptidase subunit beta